MAIKINTAYGERLTSGMLNEKISNLVGGNEKLSGFDVAIASQTSVTIKPGKAIVNGCAIEETSEIRTLTLEQEILSVDGIAYVVLNYIHETKSVIFSCVNSVANTMVKLATLFIKDGVISELTNHTTTKTLSTVVAEAAEIEAQKIRDSIPSGFVELGELDYDYMLNNENKIKIKSESVAYVNGYRIEIPADTVIDIGKAPEKESREDLLFLEAWKDSDFAKSGKLKWRIRHVADVDFNVTPEGFPPNYDFGYENRNTYIFATPQGANTSPIDVSLLNQKIRMFSKANSAPRVTNNFNPSTSVNGDIGLYIAGAKGEEQYLKPIFKTADGFVYAIPMFRLYRKPSCGKSIPFEYSKINPKVNYGKFTKLVQNEKAERVHFENIKGRSLVNLLDMTKWVNYDLLTNSVSKSTGDDNNFSVSGRFSLGGEYTLIFKSSNCTNGNLLTIHGVSSDAVNTWVISSIPNGFHKIKFTEHSTKQTDRIRCYAGNGTSPFTITDLMILEGDWTDKEIPEYFTGLKSLGEDDGNLITIKNGILNDDTYDINDGNQKLLAFSEVTHINSTNTIIPTIEANVIKGEESTPLEKLGSKLETEGHEVIEFTKIKGKTIQNLVNFKDKQYTIGQNIDVNICPTLKLDTWYTILIYVSNNTLDVPIRFSGYLFGAGDGAVFHSDSTFKGDITIMEAKETGLWRGKARLSTLGSKPEPMFTLFSKNPASGSYTASAMLLEGDHTNTPLEELPFVEGIKSVGETEDNKVVVKSCGKNLFNKKDVKIYRGLYFNRASSGVVLKSPLTTSILFKNIPNTRLIISKKPTTRFAIAFTDSDTLYVNLPINNLTTDGDTSTELLIENSGSYKYMMAYLDNDTATDEVIQSIIDSIQLEEVGSEISQATPFESYQEYKQEIHLKEPLRSLPNGVCDELVGNKVIRRVGKMVINENTPFNIIGGEWAKQPNTFAVSCRAIPNLVQRFDERALVCDTLPCVEWNNVIYRGDSEGISVYTDNNRNPQVSDINFRLSNTKVSTIDVEGVKKWLKANPITLLFEYALPVEEYLVNVYEKESIKTYQLDAPLRSLPNGIKDEIKNGVLIRRCGECAITGAGMFLSPGWENATLVTTFEGGTEVPTDCVYDTSGTNKLLCNTLNWNDFTTQLASAQSGGTGVRGITTHPYGKFIISLAKSELTSQDEAGLITWLKNNPTRVVYQLVNPTETILTESKPQDANFTLQRQFSEGSWLRELPNGVKDTVAGGKVIRRVGKLKITGSEAWDFTENGDYIRFWTSTHSNKFALCAINETNIICDKFKCYPYQLNPTTGFTKLAVEGVSDTFHRGSGDRQIQVQILKSRLSELSSNGFNTWLNQNPIEILYPLATPVEEVLSADNYMSYPCHKVNTYCGNIYVGEGRNYVISDNKMPTEDTIVVETDFREIEGKAKVEDCNFKKNDEGYDTAYTTNKTKNLIDYKQVTLSNGDVTGTLVEDGVKVKCNTAQVYSMLPINIGSLKPNTKYSLSFEANKIKGEVFVALKYGSGNVVFETNKPRVFTTPNAEVSNYRLQLYCSWANATVGEVDYTKILLVESGTIDDDYVPYEKTIKYFENTEENDIDDLRHQVSLTGFNYDQVLNESFDKLLRGEL